MMALLGMLGGGFFRLIPFIVDFFKAKHDADHEYRMTQLQLEIDKARAGQALDLAHAQGQIAQDTSEMQAWADAIKGQGQLTGVKWIDGLSASVRPVLTYWWCLFLYTTAKMIAIIVAFQAHSPLAAFIGLLITDFDTAIIGSIFSFWFVDRAIRKQSGK